MSGLWTDIMIDIETGGLSPDRAPILQIAAVKFNLEKRTVCTDFFDECLSIPPWRAWDPSTAQWWNRQKPAVLADIRARARPWKDVMMEFGKWTYGQGLRFWSKPSHFDYQFISSYLKDAEMPDAFSHQKANDLRSFLRGHYWPHEVPDVKIEFTGDAHNALYDTLHQVKMLFETIDHREKFLAQPLTLEGEVVNDTVTEHKD